MIIPKHFRFTFIKRQFSINDGFPTINEKDIYNEDELIVDIGEKMKFKGLLVICPTPIGNLNDISIRQYEALKNGDILACEDTRKTGKLIELIERKKMKDKFYSDFGVSFDEFVDKGGLDMTDEQIQTEFLKKENNEEDVNFYDFYKNKKDKKYQDKYEKLLNKKPHLKETLDEMDITDKEKEELLDEIQLNFEELKIKDFVNEKKIVEEMGKKHSKTINSSEEFKIKREILETSDKLNDIIKDRIEKMAENYEDNLKLSHKLKSKAKFIMKMQRQRNNDKKKEDTADMNDEDNNNEEILDEEISLNLGLEESMITKFKRKIKEVKDKKGRGLLISFNNENEEKRTEKLIRAMKMGLRVVIVSDAGTPTISDPGYRLVRQAVKEGIIIEPIPGPVAAITALSASGMPTDKFIFVGYLSKILKDKLDKLNYIKAHGSTAILYESPHRLKTSLELIKDIFGDFHNIYLGMELTKMHEEHIHGKVFDVIQKLENKEIKGEITIVLAPYISEQEFESDNEVSDININISVKELARKLDSAIQMGDKDFKDLIMSLTDISNTKAGRIIGSVRKRVTNSEIWYRKLSSKRTANISQPSDFLEKEKHKKSNNKI